MTADNAQQIRQKAQTAIEQDRETIRQAEIDRAEIQQRAIEIKASIVGNRRRLRKAARGIAA